MSRQIRPEDDGSHTPPPGAPENWQESWFLTWSDPTNGAGGFHHVGLQPVRGRADVWNWVALDGRVVGHYQSLDLPLPAGDLADLELGGMQIRTKDPLQCQAFSATYPDAAVDLVFESFTGAFSVALDINGADMGKEHYDSVGRMSGTIVTGQRTAAVTGWAFHDHSWGPRDYSSLLAHRWISANFGEDLFCSVAVFTSPGGTTSFGYVSEAGSVRPVASVRLDVTTADDGHSPLACDTRIWMKDGRGYHLTGESYASAMSSHDGGYFITDALTVFEMGGRLGSGLIELNQLAAPAPWHRRELGLS